MADKHVTPMLDELEHGPWPSFISGIKRLRDQHPQERISGMANSLLRSVRTLLRDKKRLLERWYRKCIWLRKRNYSKIFRSWRRFSRIQRISHPKSSASCRKLLYNRNAKAAWRKLGKTWIRSTDFPWPNRKHNVYWLNNRKYATLF